MSWVRHEKKKKGVLFLFGVSCRRGKKDVSKEICGRVERAAGSLALQCVSFDLPSFVILYIKS